MDDITISGKNLGQLALDNFCPRCFWIKLHTSNKLPYQIFPSIFSSIDSYSKKITNIFFQKYNKVPDWLSGFGEFIKPVKSPHFTKFGITENGVHLRGVTDEILLMKDDSYFIIDYKTAKYTKNQDKLMPMYEVQLNAYAYIGERAGFNPVSGIGLVYYEPDTDLKADSIDEYLLEDGFTMPFKCNLHKVKLNPDMIPALLKKVREIHDRETPPDGLNGCKDCEKLEMIININSSCS